MFKTFLFVLLVILCICSIAIASDDEIFAYYNFDQNSGQILNDVSGQGHNGIITDAVWVQSPKGFALKFDGVKGFVDLGMIAPFSTSPQCTFTAWLKLETAMLPDITTNWTIFNNEIYGSSGAILRVGGDNGKLYYRPVPNVSIISANPLINHTWHHVAVVKNADVATVFVDGISQGTLEIKGLVPATIPFTLSCSYQPINGLIDEVKLYERALSAGEVMSMFKQDAGTFGKDTSGFGKIKLHPYLYYDESKLIADVDFNGITPLSVGEQVSIELIKSDGSVIETRNINELPQSGQSDFEFALGNLLDSDYQLKAILKDSSGKIKAESKFDFHYPWQTPKAASPLKKKLPPLQASVKLPDYSLNVAANGGLEVVIAGQKFPIESHFSFPDGGFNRLTAVSKGVENEKNWKVKTAKINKSTYNVLAEGKFYKIKRVIKLQKSRIIVNDKITNLTSEPLGLIFGNSINGTGKGFDGALLGGNAVSGTVIKQPISLNPTAFLGKKGLGIGLFALDDVYTVQCRGSFDSGRVELSSDSFAIDKNASYKVEWTIYPSSTGNYYDFINQIRKDEKRNATIDGGMGLNNYIYDGAPLTKEYLEPRGVKYLVIGGLVHVWDDPEITFDGLEFMGPYPKERERLKNIAATVRKQFPDINISFHVAHSLYANNKPNETMPDSLVKNADGSLPNYSRGNYYFSENRIAQGWTWNTYFATPYNSLGKLLMKSADVMVDDMGFNSVFMDGYGLCYGAEFAYNQWDGHTADIDPITKKIIRTKGSVILLQQDAMVQFSRKMKSKGASVIANGFPMTRTTVNEKYIIYDSEIIAGPHIHLAPTPAALANPDVVRGGAGGVRELYSDIFDKLKWGNLFFHYGDIATVLKRKVISAYMYPITFEEIHAGYVKGKQRLVTSLSGIYGWNGSKELHQVYLSDARGVIVPSTFLTAVDASGVRTYLDLYENEMAVIRKIPVYIETSKPVNVIVSQYDSDKIVLSANGSGNISLNVKNGDFKIKANAAYMVNGNFVKCEKGGVLKINLKLNGEKSVVILR